MKPLVKLYGKDGKNKLLKYILETTFDVTAHRIDTIFYGLVYRSASLLGISGKTEIMRINFKGVILPNTPSITKFKIIPIHPIIKTRVETEYLKYVRIQIAKKHVKAYLRKALTMSSTFADLVFLLPQDISALLLTPILNNIKRDRFENYEKHEEAYGFSATSDLTIHHKNILEKTTEESVLQIRTYFLAHKLFQI